MRICSPLPQSLLKSLKAKQEKAVSELKKKKHNALFESLQIILELIEKWSKDDVLYNLKGGSFWSDGEHRTLAAITELESSLATKRGYSVCNNRFLTHDANNFIGHSD